MSKATYQKPYMHCPNCHEVGICPTVSLTGIGQKSEQLLKIIAHDDIKFFRRARMCSKCNKNFITVELYARFLDELVKLRDQKVSVFENLSKLLQQLKDIKKESMRNTRNISKLMIQTNLLLEDNSLLDVNSILEGNITDDFRSIFTENTHLFDEIFFKKSHKNK